MSKSRRSTRASWHRSGLQLALGILIWGARPTPAPAYEAATTLAGLTEQAALSSRLHRRLIDRFGYSLGLFEPLRLNLSTLPEDRARSLHVGMLALDGGQGYAPESLARTSGQSLQSRQQHILGWLTAGSVLETLPTSRERHHFFEPRSGRGLYRPATQTAASAAAQSVQDGMSSVRDLLAGAAIDGTGVAAPDWVSSPHNDLGVATFMAAYERAVVSESPLSRETALVETMLSAGAILAVLEQMGDPAYVRNDLAAALDGSYQRLVTERYGRAAVPGPGAASAEMPAPVRLRDLFTTAPERTVAGPKSDLGHGLAERTAARFFSLNTLPGLPLGDLPRLTASPLATSRLDSEPSGRSIAEITAPKGFPVASFGYARAPQADHLTAWTRRNATSSDGQTLARVHFSLDERCYADYATKLLPEIGRYAQRALDFLFRGELALQLADGGQSLTVRAAESLLGSGSLTLLGEQPEGTREKLATVATLPARPGSTLHTFSLSEVKPAKAPFVRYVVLFQGRDGNSEALITSAILSLPRPEQAGSPAPDAKASEPESETK